MTPPRSELRPPLPGGARALGRPGGGAISPKLASRASPEGAGVALGRPGGGAATRAKLASLGKVV